MTKPIASNTKAQHTPGPWKVEGTWISTSFTPGQPMIAHTVSDAYRTPAEARANARLIAAAPALVEALRLLCPITHLDGCAGLNFIAGCEEREQACTCGAAKARAALVLVDGK